MKFIKSTEVSTLNVALRSYGKKILETNGPQNFLEIFGNILNFAHSHGGGNSDFSAKPNFLGHNIFYLYKISNREEFFPH